MKRLLPIVLTVLLSGGAVRAQTTDDSVIDVAVFYTTAAKNAEGGTTQIKAEIDMFVAATNMAYEDSGVDQRINLVWAEEVNYTETSDSGTDLERLSSDSDGYMDKVHIRREQVWADAVILIRAGGTGVAYVMTSAATSFSGSAFGVSSRDAGTFAHELGHIMGLQHDRYEACDNNRCNQGASKYAYGYVNQKAFESGASTNTRWRTIMSYTYQCDAAGFVCQFVLRFSNPNQTYRGDPLGVASTPSNQDSIAVGGPADAARTLNDTRETVAEFRQGRAVKVTFSTATYTATEGGSAATVTVELDAAPGRILDIPLTVDTTDARTHDYSGVPETVQFTASQTEQSFTVTAVDDSVDENAETLTLAFGDLPNGVSRGSQASTTVTLADNDTLLGVPSIEDISITSDPGPDGVYIVEEEIEVTVVFDKTVTVTGTPQLELTMDSGPAQAEYSEGMGEVLVFTYPVADGDSAARGLSIAADSLALNGGTIQDATDTGTNKAADRDHAAVAADSRHSVDGKRPALQTASVDGTVVTLTYDETLDTTSTPAKNAFTVTADSMALSVDSVAVSEAVVTLTLGAQAVRGQAVRLDYTPGTKPLQDPAGNAAAALSSAAVTNTTPEPVYDKDADGLIEITTLAQLDAMRHDLDGDGIPTTAGATAYAAAFSDAGVRLTCGVSRGCGGYELLADLDFFDTNEDGQVDMDDDTSGDGQVDTEDTAYWDDGAGWPPVGAVLYDEFRTTFEGNGHTIRHLFVERLSSSQGGRQVGLFGRMKSPGVIRHVGLTDVEVTGNWYVGGLVGTNAGVITGSYVAGRVTGTGRYVGGLVGTNSGTIHASYATGRVEGGEYAGGLVGTNSGTIRASYATGEMTGRSQYAQSIGSLVGQTTGGKIRASYATGRTNRIGRMHVGGLVGQRQSGSITNSYWDTRTSGYTTGGGGTGKTTTDLQAPTGYTTGSIYENWNADLDDDSTGDDPWHFGTASQYPALKVDFNRDGTATWQGFGYQVRAGPGLTATATPGRVALSWTTVGTGHWMPPPAVTYTVYRNTGTTVEAVAEDLSGTTYTDTEVAGGTVYTYQVAAVVSGGEATWSGLQTVTALNSPPVFDDESSSTTRSVAEHTEAERDIDVPVAATDPEGGDLIYSLGGTDVLSFTIDASSGQLQTKAGVTYDYETQDSYAVTVTVSDGTDTATIAVTISVDDVNEAPAFPSTETGLRSVAENRAGVTVGAPVAATDPDTKTPTYATLTYTLDGSGAAGVFTIDDSTGQLQTAALNYEAQDSYTVTVHVSDGKDATGTADSTADATRVVTITVLNEEEAGVVELSSSAPEGKRGLTATLSDPDEVQSGSPTWQWARTLTLSPSDWSAISEATAHQYTPQDTPQVSDVGYYLQATATYTDGHGPGKSAVGETSQPVQAAPAVTLVLSPSSIMEGGVSTVQAELTRATDAETVVSLEEMPADYTLSETTLTIPVGDLESNELTLSAEDDHVDGPEEDKAVEVRGTTTNLLVTAPVAVPLTIKDNDTRGVTIVEEALSIEEGATDTYMVVLASEPTDEQAGDAVAVQVVLAVEQAGDAVSVDPESLTFTRENWSTERTVTVSTTDDEVMNTTNKTATIRHTVTGGDYGTNRVTAADVAVTVTDDESPSTTVTLRVQPTEVDEGASRTVTVTGKLDGAPRDQDTAVTIVVMSGTATAGTDFDSVASFPLRILTGQESGSATFTLTTENDKIDEPDETLTVEGSTTVGLTVLATTVTITDTDKTPKVRLEVSPKSISEGETSQVTARLSHRSSAETKVEVAATAGSGDFTLSGPVLTILAGQTASDGHATLTAVNNEVDEADKQVSVTGSATYPLGVRPPTVAPVTVTITDDDPPEVMGPATSTYMEHGTEPETSIQRDDSRTPVNTRPGTGEVATYTATNPAEVTIAWSVDEAHADGVLFDIPGGVLRFKEAPNYEARRDTPYEVMVQASDGTRTGTLAVEVLVQDAPGTVSLSSSQPRVGRRLTATVSDLDGVAEVTAWCWARAPDPHFLPADTTDIGCTPTTMETYTPVEDDLGSHLRATVTYTDGQGTPKEAPVAAVTDKPVAPRRVSSPPGGGGGGPACAEDVHGNTAAQATAMALSAVTAGAICPAADVDYFTVTALGRGLVFVDTTGSVQTRGTLWQDGAVLASGSTGRQPAARLGARVQAGPVVVAVQGQGGATGPYAVVVTFVQGYLENPGPESFQSGVGVLSGWVCDADMVEIELNGMPQEAAYGTERLDTAGVCGDVDNGFGLLVNWNRLGAGEHTVVASVDGVELGRATVTVTTLGAEFLRGAAGTCEAEDFPRLGERVTLVWQQPSQNFVIAGGSAPVGVNRAGVAGVGYLENPGPDSFQSGVGVISGWVCAAALVEVALNGVLQEAAYGTERLDTQAVCGDVDNGFGLLVNWNRLGEGEHTVVAYVDGVELGRATVRVTTVGAGAEEEFLRGAEGECVVEDFPRLGQSVLLEWQQNSQNFVITDIE